MDRSARAGLLKGREVRRGLLVTNNVEVRSANGKLTFHGLASSTSVRNGKLGDETSTVVRDNGYDMGWYTERIMRGSFSKTLSEKPDVMFLLNHEGLPLARSANGSLTLRETDDGLEYDATADSDDPDAKVAARKVNQGLMDQCSFAFRVTRQAWDDDYTQREISEVDLNRGDVSIVNFGANANTSIVMRSLLSDIGEIPESELVELRADVNVMGAVRQLIELPSFENFAGALRELRAGNAFSTNGEEAIKQFFSAYSRNDEKVEGVDEFLDELLTPKIDVATSDENEPEALSLDLAKARAYALRKKQ